MSEKHTNEHVDEVMGMKQGHAKVPRFLILVYAALAVWAVFYALTAQGIDERKSFAANNNKVDATAGKALTSQCIACHGADLKGGLGPNLVGSVDRLKEQGVIDKLQKGGVTMPAIAKTQGWSDTQVKSIVEYIKTLK